MHAELVLLVDHDETQLGEFDVLDCNRAWVPTIRSSSPAAICVERLAPLGRGQRTGEQADPHPAVARGPACSVRRCCRASTSVGAMITA